MQLRYRIVNVFTLDGQRLSGNPLCVFEDAHGLSDVQMQALALQFNLSETTFLLSAADATAGVRIFTPGMELPFAGHPTLGSAHVVHALQGGERLELRMKAGLFPVTRDGARWTLEAGSPATRTVDESRVPELLAALDLDPAALAAPPLWASTGMEQLLVPLVSTEAVARARPGAGLHAFANDFGKVGIYVFSPLAAPTLTVRFFFGKTRDSISEDPATGSACANLGAYALARGAALPLARVLRQGDAVGRPSRLELAVDAAGRIFVGGEVIEIGRGCIEL